MKLFLFFIPYIGFWLLLWWFIRNNRPLKFLAIIIFSCFTLFIGKTLWENYQNRDFFDYVWDCKLRADDVKYISVRSTEYVCETVYTDTSEILQIIKALCTASPPDIISGGHQAYHYYFMRIKKNDQSEIWVTLNVEDYNRSVQLRLSKPGTDASSSMQSKDIISVLHEILPCEASKRESSLNEIGE